MVVVVLRFRLRNYAAHPTSLSLEGKKPKAPFEYQSITFSSVVAIQTFFFVLIYYVSKYEEKEKGVSYTVATYLGESEKRPIAGDLFIVRVRRN